MIKRKKGAIEIYGVVDGKKSQIIILRPTETSKACIT